MVTIDLKILFICLLLIPHGLTAEEMKVGEKWPGEVESTYSGPSVMSESGNGLDDCVKMSGPELPVFKFEEGNFTDVKATAKLCKAILELNSRVIKEWGNGVVLRITEAYDQDSEHATYSLHNEGRAVDVTTSDRDNNKLGKLAYFATKSGFNWVYYENDHIHASVKK